MPIYASHISHPFIPRFKRIGSHIKSSRASSTFSVDTIADGEMTKQYAIRNIFGPRISSSDSALSSKSSINTTQATAVSVKIESPPLVMYGPPKDSTGALLSGLISIKNEDRQEWESFNMTLRSETVMKRPAHHNCTDCARTADVVNEWTFISAPTGSNRDILTFPFSYLLPGHLPASTDNFSFRISYYLEATAISTDGKELHYRKPLTLERSILPGPDRHSVRIFPPTNLTAAVKLPSVVHPGGDFAFDISLTGVVSHERRWRLRKTTWRIDEKIVATSPPCKVHAAKLASASTTHEDVRAVGSGEIRRGWKCDFEKEGGSIELEVIAGIPIQNRAVCNLDETNGMSIEHVLVVEMIVAEEHRPGPGKVVTPTGAARVLRMQFRLVVTARSGLGISWDEEAPPVYEDVPASPPQYGEAGARGSVTYADIPPPEPTPPINIVMRD